MKNASDAVIYQVDGWNEEEQRYEIQFDGKRYDLSFTNHDEHGWSGMEAARDVIESFSRLLNIPIEEWDCEGSGADQPKLHQIR